MFEMFYESALYKFTVITIMDSYTGPHSFCLPGTCLPIVRSLGETKPVQRLTYDVAAESLSMISFTHPCR